MDAERPGPAGSTFTCSPREPIGEVRLNWEAAYGVDYQIQASNDAASWTTIVNVAGNTDRRASTTYNGLAATARYVRVYAPGPAPASDNYSLYDFNVYATSEPDLAQGQPGLRRPRSKGPASAPAAAVDGNPGDPLVERPVDAARPDRLDRRWTSVRPRPIGEVRLNWEAAYAADYQIQADLDGLKQDHPGQRRRQHHRRRPRVFRPQRQAPLRPDLRNPPEPDQRRYARSAAATPTPEPVPTARLPADCVRAGAGRGGSRPSVGPVPPHPGCHPGASGTTIQGRGRPPRPSNRRSLTATKSIRKRRNRRSVAFQERASSTRITTPWATTTTVSPGGVASAEEGGDDPVADLGEGLAPFVGGVEVAGFQRSIAVVGDQPSARDIAAQRAHPSLVEFGHDRRAAGRRPRRSAAAVSRARGIAEQ